MDDRLRGELEAIQQCLAADPPTAALEQRIAESARTRAARAPTRLIVVAAVGVAALAFAVGRRTAPHPDRTAASVAPTTTAPTESRQAETAITEPRRLWDGQLLVDTACELSERGDELSAASSCRLQLLDPPMTMELWRATRLRRASGGVRVLDGTVAFAVDPVPAGSPRTRIEVGAGAIEVIGTRFVVEQSSTRGHVDLLEGAIDFVTADEMTRSIEPGRRLSWTEGTVEPDRVAIAAAPQRTVRSGTPVRDLDRAALDRVLEQVATLRRSGSYRDAIAVLHRARRDVEDAGVAEVLSYEEGTLRMHDDSSVELCAYWRGHLARFGAGDHAASIRAHMNTARCDEP